MTEFKIEHADRQTRIEVAAGSKVRWLAAAYPGNDGLEPGGVLRAVVGDREDVVTAELILRGSTVELMLLVGSLRRAAADLESAVEAADGEAEKQRFYGASEAQGRG